MDLLDVEIFEFWNFQTLEKSDIKNLDFCISSKFPNFRISKIQKSKIQNAKNSKSKKSKIQKIQNLKNPKF